MSQSVVAYSGVLSPGSCFRCAQHSPPSPASGSAELFQKSLLTLNSYRTISSVVQSVPKGVVARRFDGGIGCGACGRGLTWTPHPGGAGAPLGATMGPCREPADGDRPAGRCEKLQLHAKVRAESAARRLVKRRDGAPAGASHR